MRLVFSMTLATLALGVLMPVHAADESRSSQEVNLDRMINQIRSQAHEDCRDGQFQECIGASGEQCRQRVDTVLSGCRREALESDGRVEPAMGRCLEREMPREFGVEESELQACMGQPGGSGGPSDSDSMSPEEARERAQAQQERAMEQAQEAQRRHLEAQGVSRDDITLPVYPEAEMTSYLEPGTELGRLQGEELALAEDIAQATLTTSDSAEEVAAFYRDRLDGFTEVDSGMAGDVVFVDGEVPDAQPLSRQWLRTMHGQRCVSIVGGQGSTQIQIHYEP